MEKEYLYGASVQGIQEFIFQTNKLKEIVGASQIVENITGSKFDEFCKEETIDFANSIKIMSAAGNIKYLLSEEDCKKMVKTFPKYVSNYAPGITISQAVVKTTGNLKSDMDILEKKLKSQRNKAEMPVNIGFMGLERARRTGGIAVEIVQGDFIDRPTEKKIMIPKQDTLSVFKKITSEVTVEEVPFKLEDITRGTERAWLAIIHADGNALGLKLQNLASSITSNEDVKNAFSKFSSELELATEEAAQQAFEKVVKSKMNKNSEGEDNKYPFRPVILGGDDLTVIIRADLAYSFTKEYLKAFEEKTRSRFSFMKNDYNIDDFAQGLTACAGIAYVKESYPFHYGVHLAESLTGSAKKYSKNINSDKVPSSLSFYKVQSSFIEDLESMKKRTHYAKASKVSFDYGPYLLDENGNIPELDLSLEYLESIKKNDSKGISKISHWLTELHKDEGKAEFLMERIKNYNDKLFKSLHLDEAIVKNNAIKKSIIQDIIHLHTF